MAGARLSRDKCIVQLSSEHKRSSGEFVEALRFEIVGTWPKSFNHAELGLVDTYFMHKFLEEVQLTCHGHVTKGSPYD